MNLIDNLYLKKDLTDNQQSTNTSCFVKKLKTQVKDEKNNVVLKGKKIIMKVQNRLRFLFRDISSKIRETCFKISAIQDVYNYTRACKTDIQSDLCTNLCSYPSLHHVRNNIILFFNDIQFLGLQLYFGQFPYFRLIKYSKGCSIIFHSIDLLGCTYIYCT